MVEKRVQGIYCVYVAVMWLFRWCGLTFVLNTYPKTNRGVHREHGEQTYSSLCSPRSLWFLG